MFSLHGSSEDSIHWRMAGQLFLIIFPRKTHNQKGILVIKLLLFLCLSTHMGPGWTWLHGTGTALKDSTDSGRFPMGNNTVAAVPRGQIPGHLADPLETLLNQLNSWFGIFARNSTKATSPLIASIFHYKQVGDSTEANRVLSPDCTGSWTQS